MVASAAERRTGRGPQFGSARHLIFAAAHASELCRLTTNAARLALIAQESPAATLSRPAFATRITKIRGLRAKPGAKKTLEY